jgi:hypothetical protein
MPNNNDNVLRLAECPLGEILVSIRSLGTDLLVAVAVLGIEQLFRVDIYLKTNSFKQKLKLQRVSSYNVIDPKIIGWDLLCWKPRLSVNISGHLLQDRHDLVLVLLSLSGSQTQANC